MIMNLSSWIRSELNFPFNLMILVKLGFEPFSSSWTSIHTHIHYVCVCGVLTF
ncbi:hypothetical protein Hanom_Chr07g00595611 [Helianthus anomalus]